MQGELRAATHMIPAPWEGSTPGVPQTNSRIERTVQDVCDGLRVFLHQAGLPNCFWPAVGHAFAFN